MRLYFTIQPMGADGWREMMQQHGNVCTSIFARRVSADGLGAVQQLIDLIPEGVPNYVEVLP